MFKEEYKEICDAIKGLERELQNIEILLTFSPSMVGRIKRNGTILLINSYRESAIKMLEMKILAIEVLPADNALKGGE